MTDVGPVESAVRRRVTAGQRLFTPAKHEPFEVGAIRLDAIVLLFGASRTPTRLPWTLLEELRDGLAERDWVTVTGSGRSVEIVEGTLDGFLKRSIRRYTASWVAALLDHAELVELDTAPPMRVRLRR